MSPWVYREEPQFEMPRSRTHLMWVSEFDVIHDQISSLEKRVSKLEGTAVSKEEPKQ